MQVILQGSLRQFPLAELLPFVGRRTESGTLDVETTGRRTRILFTAGNLTWAQSAKSDDPLEATLEAFDWASGTFTLLDSAVVPEGAKRVSIPFQALLDEAKKRAESGSYSDATLFRVVDAPALQQNVSLTGDQLQLLFRLAAGKTFRDLVGELGVARPELGERLQRLQSLGLIQVVPRRSSRPTARRAAGRWSAR